MRNLKLFQSWRVEFSFLHTQQYIFKLLDNYIDGKNKPLLNHAVDSLRFRTRSCWRNFAVLVRKTLTFQPPKFPLKNRKIFQKYQQKGMNFIIYLNFCVSAYLMIFVFKKLIKKKNKEILAQKLRLHNDSSWRWRGEWFDELKHLLHWALTFNANQRWNIESSEWEIWRRNKRRKKSKL